MATYRIHRLKEHLRNSFRTAAHVTGAAHVKPRDYEPAGTIDGASPYAAYFSARGTDAPLTPGDLLEDESGALRIFKFVGFEEAQWVVLEPVAEAAATLPPAEASADATVR